MGNCYFHGYFLTRGNNWGEIILGDIWYLQCCLDSIFDAMFMSKTIFRKTTFIFVIKSTVHENIHTTAEIHIYKRGF